jgi:hypothetical protein
MAVSPSNNGQAPDAAPQPPSQRKSVCGVALWGDSKNLGIVKQFEARIDSLEKVDLKRPLRDIVTFEWPGLR